MTETLTKKDLIEKIQYLYETDIGDFKRKSALYLNRFIENQQSTDLKKKLNDLKHEALYQEMSHNTQMQNIDEIRFFLIEKLKKI